LQRLEKAFQSCVREARPPDTENSIYKGKASQTVDKPYQILEETSCGEMERGAFMSVKSGTKVLLAWNSIIFRPFVR
jgi:hypothetical protein